jgi:hypothetical protein
MLVPVLLDEAREAELGELVARLDRLIPKEGAHLSLPASADPRAIVGNRLGYLRFGVEILRAALRPAAGSDDSAPGIAPQLDYLASRETPFAFGEIDESITSRPPVASSLGALGQLAAAVLVVGAVVALFIAASVLWRWVFG